MSEGDDGEWFAATSQDDSTWEFPADEEFWSRPFLPPPPRPPFLDDQVESDGLTTCDLCTWARLGTDGANGFDFAQEYGPELGWALTLAIVSVVSAAVGAVVMVAALHCRSRMKTQQPSTGFFWWWMSRSSGASPDAETRSRQKDKAPSLPLEERRVHIPPNRPTPGIEPSGGRVWSWLGTRRPAPVPSPPVRPVTANHYTIEEPYPGPPPPEIAGEALYAELDRESSSSPAYQNTAYSGSDVEPDVLISSAPSSAYYSDLSAPDRTYEAVGWEPPTVPRLAAINETVQVPSDYV